MFTEQEIESFLHGNDPEEFIVAIEYDYRENCIYKINRYDQQHHHDTY